MERAEICSEVRKLNIPGFGNTGGPWEYRAKLETSSEIVKVQLDTYGDKNRKKIVPGQVCLVEKQQDGSYLFRGFPDESE